MHALRIMGVEREEYSSLRSHRRNYLYGVSRIKVEERGGQRYLLTPAAATPSSVGRIEMLALLFGAHTRTNCRQAHGH